MTTRKKPFKAKAWFGHMHFTSDTEPRGDIEVPPHFYAEEPVVQPTVRQGSTGILPFVAGWWIGRHG